MYLVRAGYLWAYLSLLVRLAQLALASGLALRADTGQLTCNSTPQPQFRATLAQTTTQAGNPNNYRKVRVCNRTLSCSAKTAEFPSRDNQVQMLDQVSAHGDDASMRVVRQFPAPDSARSESKPMICLWDRTAKGFLEDCRQL